MTVAGDFQQILNHKRKSARYLNLLSSHHKVSSGSVKTRPPFLPYLGAIRKQNTDGVAERTRRRGAGPGVNASDIGGFITSLSARRNDKLQMTDHKSALSATRQGGSFVICHPFAPSTLPSSLLTEPGLQTNVQTQKRLGATALAGHPPPGFRSAEPK
jgi:hypothetical protein